jgi:indole-3-glycerol phosphate synthase
MSILERILHDKRAEVGRLAPWRAALRKQAEASQAARDFAGALRREGEVVVVAEVKRRSPSAGWIRRELNAAGLASAYEHGGASAVSVLTDGPGFGGSREDLESARAAVAVPVLRKDFIVDAVQVYESRAMGADAVLLIVRALEPAALGALIGLAAELGMCALVEAHDRAELERALKAGARVVGINNRDLTRFETDLSVAESLAADVPEEIVVVGESGIRTAADVDRLGSAGVDAVLVGESLVRADDPVEAVRVLARRPRGPRGAVG